jgi:chloramphenicol-sensitive protein RarD
MSKTGIGYAYAFIAYSLWGILPVYWKLLSFANPYEILSHRILWSFVFALLLIIVLKRENPLILLRKKKNILIVAATGVTISINWLVYIYAINSGFIVEASLGYYINPLVSVFLGVFFLKEKLAALQKVALVLSAAGVAYLTIRYGKFPWIALGLAFSFAAYGLLKKLFALDTIGSLMLETMFVSPLALGFLVFGVVSGSGPWASHFLYRLPLSPVLFAACGIVTSVPLALFAEGAKRIPLSSIGFLQYISPTLTLLVGLMFYGEQFTSIHAVSFGLIWTGLILNTTAVVRKIRGKTP